MPKVAEEPLVSIHLRLFESDLATLRRLYAQTPGVNMAIRSIVRSFLRQVEATAAAKIDAGVQPKFDLPRSLLSNSRAPEDGPDLDSGPDLVKLL